MISPSGASLNGDAHSPLPDFKISRTHGQVRRAHVEVGVMRAQISLIKHYRNYRRYPVV